MPLALRPLAIISKAQARPNLVYKFFFFMGKGELLGKYKKKLPLAPEDMWDKNNKKIKKDIRIAE